MLARQLNQTDNQSATQAAASQSASQPASRAGKWSARAVSQVATASCQQPVAARSQQLQAVSQPADSRVVLRGVALLYESPGGNQVDGVPPVPTSRLILS